MASTPDRTSSQAALFVYAAGLPLVFALLGRGLDNFFWSEDAFWLGRASAILEGNLSEIFRLYGRDFNPVSALISALALKFFGPTPAAGHLFDLAIHLFSGALLALLIARITREGALAGVLAILWTLSRHTDETVFWIAARPTALSFCLFLLAWNVLERGLSKTGALIYLFAVLAKEPAVVLAPLFIARRLITRTSLRDSRPLVLIFFGYLVFRFVAWSSGASDDYRDPWTIGFLLQKCAFIISQFLELPLPWSSAATFIAAALFLALAWLFGGTPGRMGCVWLLLGLAPFLPIPKHTPRYCMFGYPGFLLACGGLWLTLRDRFASVALPLGVATALIAAAFQGYIVFMDELDHDMRAGYVRSIEHAYAQIAPDIPSGPVALISASHVHAQPEINARTRVAKLNAPIPGGLWGIILPNEIVIMHELTRGRIWTSTPGDSPTIVIHTATGFQIADTFPPDPDGPPIYGHIE